jgi:hypothetical protein
MFLAVGFFSWWYSAGWATLSKNVQNRLNNTLAMFSVPSLMRTLFAPWKRIVTNPGAGLAAHLSAIGDNMVSRAIGFTVRLFVLIAALVSVIIVATVGIVQIALWPFIPLAIVYGLVMAI